MKALLARMVSFGASSNRTWIIPNGVDLRRFAPAQKASGPQIVLFIGSFRHLPNLLAFEPSYRNADFVAGPLPLSAGTNIKVLESDGCELVVGEIAYSNSSFPKAVISLLRNQDLRTNLALNARRTTELRFGWDRIAIDALASYAAVTADKASSRLAKHA